MKDPTGILKLVDLACKSIDLVSYEVSVEGTEAAEAMVGSGKAKITSVGYQESAPDKFVFDAEVDFPGQQGKRKFTAGSDGNKYYLIDHVKKTFHEDYERYILGAMRRPMLNSLIIEFHHSEPFSYEIKADEKTLLGEKVINEEKCYEIRVLYSKERKDETVWCVSKKDFLPRYRKDLFDTRDGQRGGIVISVSNLVVAPKLSSDFFKAKVPAGYEKTGKPAD